MAIYSWFIHKKWWFSIVMLAVQRVPTVFVVGCHCHFAISAPVERWPPFIILELLHLRSHIINFPGRAVETQHEPEPRDIHRHHLFDVENPSTILGGRWIPPQPTFSWTFPFHAAGIRQESDRNHIHPSPDQKNQDSPSNHSRNPGNQQP